MSQLHQFIKLRQPSERGVDKKEEGNNTNNQTSSWWKILNFNEREGKNVLDDDEFHLWKDINIENISFCSICMESKTDYYVKSLYQSRHILPLQLSDQ